MKKIVVFIIVGLIMFGVGFGGGLMFGRSMAENAAAQGAASSVPEPGPMVPVGEFISNLAGSGRHVLSFSLSLEALNLKATETLNSEGWFSRIKNEVLMVVKDKIYEDLTSAEGMLQLAEEIKRTLNAQLPQVDGEPPVARALFDSFVLQ